MAGNLYSCHRLLQEWLTLVQADNIEGVEDRLSRIDEMLAWKQNYNIIDVKSDGEEQWAVVELAGEPFE
jgi:hypothetical protein